jgi:hypothetical protein
MDNRNLNRRLDWVALHMPYIVCPTLIAGLAVSVGVLHG